MTDIMMVVLIVFVIILIGLQAKKYFDNKKTKTDQEERLAKYLGEQDEKRDYWEKKYKECKDKLSKNKENGHPILVMEFIHNLSDKVPHDSRDQIAHDYIEFDQAFRIMRALRANPNTEVSILLHTFGGYSLASEIIATALKDHKGKTSAYIPYVALSGGTVIALACESIKMGTNAALGPIDTQFYGFSGRLYTELLKRKSPDSIDDFTFLLALEAEQAFAESIKQSVSVANKVHRTNGLEAIQELASGKRPHSQRILPHEAKQLGFIIEEGCPDDVYQLVDSKLQLMRLADSQEDDMENVFRSVKHNALRKYFSKSLGKS